MKALFRGKRLDNGEWVEGLVVHPHNNRWLITPHCSRIEYPIDPNTISQDTDLTDKNGKKIFENYLVKLFGRVGVVCKCQGAYGIGFEKAISFAKLDNYTYSHNQTIPHYLYCDNFISFWELMWNFDCEDNMCNVVEVIGNKWDNPELLEEEH